MTHNMASSTTKRALMFVSLIMAMVSDYCNVVGFQHVELSPRRKFHPATNSFDRMDSTPLLVDATSAVFHYCSSSSSSRPTSTCSRTKSSTSKIYMSSDWSDFSTLDDEDELDELRIDTRDYAAEEDSQEAKAQIGASLEPPTIENDAPPIEVPAGSQLELDEETVKGVLSACRAELGTLFGYTDENRGVGITGGVDYVEMDGPTVVVRLKGRFWHQRTTVLDRVSNYLIQRIPEIIEVTVEDEWQLTDEANEVR